MMKRTAILGFVYALVLLSANLAGAQTIQGKLVDEVTGDAVASGAVFLAGLDGAIRSVTRSDADGRFTLQSGPGDTVRVRVERGGYQILESKP